MKKTQKFLFSVFIIIFMFYIIKNPEISSEIVLKGLNLCYLVIIPVIFPFMIFSKMFINSMAFKFLGEILNKPARFLFGISGEYANAFIIGCIMGFPMGAKTVKEVYLSNNINKNEAERTLAFCNNCSISFAVSAAGIMVFGSFKIGLYIFCIQLLSSIITGIIIKFLFKENTSNQEINEKIFESDKTSIDFTEMISESVSGILNICGTVLFFYIATNVTLEFLKSAPFISNLFEPEKHEIFYGLIESLLSGTFEISSGIYSLINFNIPMYYKLILSAIILAWSGISVHFQIMYILKDIDLSFKLYFTGKIIHVIISILTTAIFFRFINPTKISETFAWDFSFHSYYSGVNNLNTYTRGLIVTGIISLIMTLIIFIIAGISCLLEKNKNSKKEVRK